MEIIKIKCQFCGHKKGRMRAKGLTCTFCKSPVPDSQIVQDMEANKEKKQQKPNKLKQFIGKIFNRGE